MHLNRKSARKMISDRLRPLVFPLGKPDWAIVADIAARATTSKVEVLPKDVNQLINGAADLVSVAALNRVMEVLNLDEKLMDRLHEYHEITVDNPPTRFVRRRSKVERAHPARRSASQAMVRR